jgi:hypothetical protein
VMEVDLPAFGIRANVLAPGRGSTPSGPTLQEDAKQWSACT